MDRDSATIQRYLSYIIKTLFAILGLLMVLSVITIEANKKSPEEIAEMQKKAKKMQAILAKGGSLNENLPVPWPPKMNNVYPDFELLDQEGKEFSLSSLKGKVIIIEFIDIFSPVSQAQSGAALLGAYLASPSQEVDKYSQPFSEVLRKSVGSGLVLPHESITELKIIIYGENGAGSRDDAQNWSDHFNMKKSENIVVAVPKKDMRSKETQSIITGYQLIDKNMILRVDSSGVSPKHNLSMTLAPLVPKLLR